MNVKEKRTEDIPEVVEHLRAATLLREFMQFHEEFAEELEYLVEQYNRTMEIAERAVREQQVTCGPFRLMGAPSVKWDANGLVEDIGQEEFINIGGTAQTSVVYKIDKKKADAAASQGIIPAEVADAHRKVTPRYTKPNKIVLP